MPTFFVDDDVVALVSERAMPKHYESFSDALRRALETTALVKPAAMREAPRRLPSGDELFAELEQFSASEAAQRKRAPKADLRELVAIGLLSEGQELFFVDYRGQRHGDAKATVSESDLAYKGKLHSMSRLAGQLLQKAGFTGKSVRGPEHWATADGKLVRDLWQIALRRKAAK